MHATFFVVGSEVARHPGIVRALVRDGNEIGNHTFTHVALSNGPSGSGGCNSSSPKPPSSVRQDAMPGLSGRRKKQIRRANGELWDLIEMGLQL